MSSRDPFFFASNPFATRYTKPGAQPYLSPSEPYLPLDQAVLSSLVERLCCLHRGLIVGPHGSGKSTLVQSLLPSLTARYSSILLERMNRYPDINFRVWCQQWLDNLRRLHRLVRRCHRGGVVVLDGLEQVPWLIRLLFCAVLAIRRCDLLATSHHRIWGVAELYRAELNPALIRHLATELTRDSPAGNIDLVQDELNRRDLSKVTNARDLWFDLYDLISNYNATEACKATESIKSLNRSRYRTSRADTSIARPH